MAQPHTRKEREVWQAINSLQADGLRIDDMTGELIAERLLVLGYNRGSSTDVYRFKRSWVASHAASGYLERVEPLSLASQLSDPITQAATALKEKISQEAQLEVSRIREESQQQIEKLQQLLDESQARIAELLLQKKQQYDELENLRQENNILTQQAQYTKVQFDESILTVGLLRAQIDQLRHDHAIAYQHMQNSAQQFREEHAKVTVESKAAQQRTLDMLKENIESQRHHYMVDIDHAKEQIKKLTQQLYTLTGDHRVLQENIHLKENELAQYAKQKNQWQTEIAQLNKDKNHYQTKLIELQAQYSQLSKWYEREKEQLQTYTLQLERSSGKIQQLEQELENKELLLQYDTEAVGSIE